MLTYLRAATLAKLTASGSSTFRLLDVQAAGRLTSIGVAGAEGYHFFTITVDPNDPAKRTLPGLNVVHDSQYVVAARKQMSNGFLTLDLDFDHGVSIDVEDSGQSHQRSTYWVCWEQ
jgi:hypothetical protein